MKNLRGIAFIALIYTADAYADQPIAVILQSHLSLVQRPVSQSECINVSKAGTAEITVRMQEKPSDPVALDTYRLRLTEEQMDGLTAALQSADVETLPISVEPKTPVLMKQSSTLVIATFREGIARKVGYVEIEGEDGSNANDLLSARQIEHSKQALVPLQHWIQTLNLKLAVREAEPVTSCPGID